MFSLRIVSTVHYQAEPIPDLDVTYSPFRSADVKKVPILCIFGATPAGQKTCMHVHGVFPYLYVLYDGTQPLDSYLRRFAASLDKAINIANNSNANTHHVFKISLVSGIPMYGFHEEEKQFLKIYLYNPYFIRKAADLLLGGAVMNKSFQPHEAHIPFPLQLFMDYNLYGMNLINVAAVKFRTNKSGNKDNIVSAPSTSSASENFLHRRRSKDEALDTQASVESVISNSPSMRLWDVAALPSDLTLPDSVERHSTCELEVDVVAADILNRKDVEDNIGGNPGLAALWEDERQRKRDAGQGSQITPEDSQEHKAVEAAESEKKLLEQLAEIIKQHRELRRSHSEESDLSMEDVTLSQTAVPSAPASQIEDHTNSTENLQALASSQDTIMAAEEQDESPLVSLESIQRVVSFSQSFSRSSSQTSSSSAPAVADETGDHLLAKMLASLAEESSPASSQQSVVLAALEDQDSIVGHSLALPPEAEALKEDEEDTLEMSQIISEPIAVPDEERFNLEGLDASWSGSPDESNKYDGDNKESEDDDDDEDIPQLDGASDEKPSTSKSSKKRLGVRGPVVAGGQGMPAGTSDYHVTSPPAPQYSTTGSPAAPQYSTTGSPAQQQQSQAVSFPFGYSASQQQWTGDGSTGQTYGTSTYSRTSSAGQAGGWPQSPPQGCYSAVYGQSRAAPSQDQQSASGYRYYSHAQNFGSATGQMGTMAGRQGKDEPHFPLVPSHPGLSPPSSSSSYYPGGCSSGVQAFHQQGPFQHVGASPQHSPYMHPNQEPFQQPHQTVPHAHQGMASMRRHSEGSITQPVVHSSSQGPVSSHYKALPATSVALSVSSPLHETSWTLSSASGDTRDAESAKPQLVSTLQTLLEASTSSSCTDIPNHPPSTSGSHLVRRTVSVDSSSLPFSGHGVDLGDLGSQNENQFKLPEKRSSSFSAHGDGGLTVLDHSQAPSQALSSLFNFVANVDSLGGGPSPAPTSLPTPESTPASTPTPNSAPSPELQSRDDEVKTYMDLSSGQLKVSPRPSPVPNVESKLLTGESLPVVSTDEAMSPSVMLWRYTGSIMDDPVLGQEDGEIAPILTSAGRETPVVGNKKVEGGRLGKQGRMKKLGLNHHRLMAHGSSEVSSSLSTSGSSPLYTYTFHVPTPVFKRLKLQGICSHRGPDVKVVRMHPRDARRYSLLKIGRELVRLTRLSAREIANISNALRDSAASRSAPERPLSPHNSLVDPQTGEVVVMGVQPKKAISLSLESKPSSIIMQSSRLVGTARHTGSKPRRLMGPKCKRQKKFSDANCQTVVSAIETVSSCSRPSGESTYEARPNQRGGMYVGSSNMYPPTVEQHRPAGQTDMSGHGLSHVKNNGSALGMTSQSPLFTSGWHQSPSVESELGADDRLASSLPHPSTPGPGQYADQWGSDSNHSHSSGSWRMQCLDGVPRQWSDGPTQPGHGATWQSGYYQAWQYPPLKTEREHVQNRVTSDMASGVPSSPNTCQPAGWSVPVSSSTASVTSLNPSPLSSSPSSSSSRPLSASYSESTTATSAPAQQPATSSAHLRCNYGTYSSVQFSYPSPEEFSGDSYATQAHGQNMYSSQVGNQKLYINNCSTYPGLHDAKRSQAGQASSHTSFSPSHSMSPTQYSTFAASGFQDGQHAQFSPPGSSQHHPFFPVGQGDGHPSCLPPDRNLHYPTSPNSHAASYQTTQHAAVSSPPQSHCATNHQGNFVRQQKGFPAYSPFGRQNSSPPVSGHTGQFPAPVGQLQNGSAQCSVPASSSESLQRESSAQEALISDTSSKHFLDQANQLQPFLQKGAWQDTNTTARDVAEETGASCLKSQSLCPARPVPYDSAPALAVTSEQEAQSSSSQHQNPSTSLPAIQPPRPEKATHAHSSCITSDPLIVSSCFQSKAPGLEKREYGFFSSDDEGKEDTRACQNQNEVETSQVKIYECASSSEPKEGPYNLQIVSRGQRRVTLEMFSTDESEDDKTNDSSDEYTPSSSSRMRGIKRKKRRKVEHKRAKRMSVNYGRNAFAHFLDDRDQRERRRGRPRKSRPQRHDQKSEKLIEGIHYIIVGKFKGHRVMLVKVHKVEVGLNERVMVSKWLGSSESSRVKGMCLHSSESPCVGEDTCNESAFAGTSFYHPSTQDDIECLSDASTIIGDFGLPADNSDESADQKKISGEISNRREGERKDVLCNSGGRVCFDYEKKEEKSSFSVRIDNKKEEAVGCRNLKYTLVSCEDLRERPLSGSSDVFSKLSLEASGALSATCFGDRNADGIANEIAECDGKVTFRREVDERNGEVEKIKQDSICVSNQPEEMLLVCEALQNERVTKKKFEKIVVDQGMCEVDTMTKSASMHNFQQAPEALEKIRNQISEHQDRTVVVPAHAGYENNLSMEQSSSNKILDRRRPKNQGKKSTVNSSEEREKKTSSDKLSSFKESSQNILFSKADLGHKLAKPARRKSPGQMQESKKYRRLIEHAATDNSTVKPETAPGSLEPHPCELESGGKGAADLAPRIAVPVAVPGKLPTDSSFVVCSQPSSAEHSQDADCSSLPHSSPDSDSSLPAFPRISFTNSLPPNLKDKCCNDDFPTSGSRQCQQEQKDIKRQSPPPVIFHVQRQSRRARLKEAHASQPDKLGDSSDSSDSNPCFSSGNPAGGSLCGRVEPLASLSRKAKLELKEINKKQKQLTPNQRLGVAFLSRKSRRKKKSRSRVKNRKAGNCGAGKLMNSLSLLHMATLANLGGEQPTADHKENSLPHYCDQTNDHAEIYQDSLNKMSYVSPVSSDKGELSPPTPASPSDPKRKWEQRKGRRPMKAAKAALVDLRSDENLGTEPISISQLVARSAREAKIKQSKTHLHSCWPPHGSQHSAKRKLPVREGENFIRGESRRDLSSEGSPAYHTKIPCPQPSSVPVTHRPSHSEASAKVTDRLATPSKSVTAIQTSDGDKGPPNTRNDSHFSLQAAHNSFSDPVVERGFLPVDPAVSFACRAEGKFNQNAEHLRTFSDTEMSSKRYCDKFVDNETSDRVSILLKGEVKQGGERDLIPGNCREFVLGRSENMIDQALGANYVTSKHPVKTKHPENNCTVPGELGSEDQVEKNGWHASPGWSSPHVPTSARASSQGKYWQELGMHSTLPSASTHKVLPAHSPHKTYVPVSPQKVFSSLSPSRAYHHPRIEGKLPATSLLGSGRELWPHSTSPHSSKSFLECGMVDPTFPEVLTSLQKPSPSAKLSSQCEIDSRAEEKLSVHVLSPKTTPTALLPQSSYVSATRLNSEHGIRLCLTPTKPVDLSYSVASPKVSAASAASERNSQVGMFSSVEPGGWHENPVKSSASGRNTEVCERSPMMSQCSTTKVLTSAVSHPTWTSVKTDKFENITDDEDEDVIPSSQVYSSMPWFSSFRQADTVTPVWALPPAIMQSGTPGSYLASPDRGLDNCIEKYHLQTTRNSIVGMQSSSVLTAREQDCVEKGLPSLDAGTGHTVSKEGTANQVGRCSAEDETDGCRTSADNQALEKSYVSGVGTPWRESQMLNNSSTSITSNFEPITDSESEDENSSSKAKWQESNRHILWNSRYGSFGFASSPIAYHLNSPVYTAYSSLKSSLSYSHQLSQQFYLHGACSGKMVTSTDRLSQSPAHKFTTAALGNAFSSKPTDILSPCLASRLDDKDPDFVALNCLSEAAQTGMKRESAHPEKLLPVWHTSLSGCNNSPSERESLADGMSASSPYLARVDAHLLVKDKLWQQQSGTPSLLGGDAGVSSGGDGYDVFDYKHKLFGTDNDREKFHPYSSDHSSNINQGQQSKDNKGDGACGTTTRLRQCHPGGGPDSADQQEKRESPQHSPAEAFSARRLPSSNERRRDQSSGRADPASSESKRHWIPDLQPACPEYVLCPQLPPPSRESLEASCVSYGLSLEPAIKAFCSNPADLPDKPRELGGRVLQLVSCRVADLEEVKPPTGIRGLSAWQSEQLASCPLLGSQPPADGNLGFSRERLTREPQLRFALTGDSPCIITPVRPPPSAAVVTTWIQNKLKALETEKTRDIGQGAPPICGGLETSKVAESSEVSLGQETPVEEDSEGEGGDAADGTVGREDTFTILKKKTTKICSAQTLVPALALAEKVPSQVVDEIPGSPECLPLVPVVLHSTPARMSLNESLEADITPTAEKQTKESEGRHQEPVYESSVQSEFVTPRRLPFRRLSTNTERVLRQNICASQAKLGLLREETDVSQIDGPTPNNIHGFKVTQRKLQDAKALHRHQYLTVLSLELHAETRGDLMPDPEADCIHAIFYAIFDDIPPDKGSQKSRGVLVVDAASCVASAGACDPRPSTSKASASSADGSQTFLNKCGIMDNLRITYVPTETDLLMQVIEIVTRIDPDVLVGFEVQQLSWGFLLQRAAHLNIDLPAKISRVQGLKRGSRVTAEKDEWGADHTSEIHIEGRIILNLWRVLRHEVTLNAYTYENCAYHILHQRVPTYSFRTLTFWYSHSSRLHRWRVVSHYTERVTGELAMLDHLDIIGKTSEFARVFGIEFYEVLSRGSQYRVESMMLRLAKPLNFIPVSPSLQQRIRQKAGECIPLNLEPESRFYVDPVVVLDFQSLYPSIMIAYNYCFSTCLGRLQHLASAHEGPIEFGCTSLNVTPSVLRKLGKNVTVSPNGCVFVKQNVRRGVLPMMVDEILRTRLMVKNSMKQYKADKTLHRMLDARQLSLKLIANVTYGYTNANFSGRMPCIEVADSIVRKARESLECAIGVVKRTTRWQAHVVYGDTDSMFIHLPGRTKEQAFVIGQEIADTITSMFPKPMKLRFEKVYLPCVLQTKKRYVGYMYETPLQKEPVFDAKGIETVRRDNCGVVSKILEKSIKILFTSKDVSLVRTYVQNQFTKMLHGRVGLQDFIFAKEYRGMMGYKPGACVPALEIARTRLREDRRAEPRVGERVPYLIVHGSPGLPLIKLVRQPLEVIQDPTLRINVAYYINKQVLPCLDRLFGLVGINVFSWYENLPRVLRVVPHGQPLHPDTKQGTISQYFVTSDCALCEQQTKQVVCAACMRNPQMVAVTLASRCAAWERVEDRVSQVCFTCMGVKDSSQPCTSLDCPVLFRRLLASSDLQRVDRFRDVLDKVLSF